MTPTKCTAPGIEMKAASNLLSAFHDSVYFFAFKTCKHRDVFLCLSSTVTPSLQEQNSHDVHILIRSRVEVRFRLYRVEFSML